LFSFYRYKKHAIFRYINNFYFNYIKFCFALRILKKEDKKYMIRYKKRFFRSYRMIANKNYMYRKHNLTARLKEKKINFSFLSKCFKLLRHRHRERMLNFRPKYKIIKTKYLRGKDLSKKFIFYKLDKIINFMYFDNPFF